jgi:hypothetical protein
MATVGQMLVIYLQLTHRLFTYYNAHAGVFHILLLHGMASCRQFVSVLQVYLVGVRVYLIHVALAFVTYSAAAR